MKSVKAAVTGSTSEPARLRRFVRIAEVRQLTGLSTSTIYLKMSQGEFPRQVRLFDSNLRNAVVWLEDELIAWQEARIAERDQPPSKPERKRKTGYPAITVTAG